MPKRFFRRFTQDVAHIRAHPRLQFFGTLLHDPRLWHFHRRNLASGVAIGLFIAFVPLPMQMIFAAALAILFRANLPVAVSLVWLTNPITMPPVFFAAYQFGEWLLGLPPSKIDMTFSLEWVQQMFAHIWQPFVLGLFIFGVTSALIGYITIHVVWAIAVRRAWRGRKRKANPDVSIPSNIAEPKE